MNYNYFLKLVMVGNLAHLPVKTFVCGELSKLQPQMEIKNRRVWQPNPLPFLTLKSKIYFDSYTKILKTLGFWNYTRFQTCVRKFRTTLTQMPKDNLKKHPLYLLTLLYFLTFTLVGNLAHLPEKPSVGGEVSKS